MSDATDARIDGERAVAFIREDDITLFGLMNISPQRGALADAFSSLAQQGISVLMIGYSQATSKSRDLSIMVREDHAAVARRILHSCSTGLQYQTLLEETGLTRISIDRSGAFSHIQTLSLLADCMGKLHLSLRMLSVSGMNISCVLDVRRSDPTIDRLRAMMLQLIIKNEIESNEIVETMIE